MARQQPARKFGLPKATPRKNVHLADAPDADRKVSWLQSALFEECRYAAWHVKRGIRDVEGMVHNLAALDLEG
jgi:hypothetical protein